MKENSIEKDEEILNNIKAYMQENIDKGYNKFIYNDLGYDEKCIDVINTIEHILSDYKRLLKENEEWQRAYQEEKDRQFDMIRKSQEKDKIIDLMADKIFKEGIVWENREEVKQYFENKAKEVN